MLNIIWMSIIVLSSVYGIATGNGAEVTDGFFEGAESCISFITKTGSFMILWQAVLSVAEKGGLSDILARLMSPVICRLFKGVKKNSHALSLISNNITANILGLSNAATPIGMEAMKELSKKSKSLVATNDMCLLAVLNSASLQLIPSTLIAMRSSYMSKSPAEITVPIWIVSSATVVFAIVLTKIMEKGGNYNK